MLQVGSNPDNSSSSDHDVIAEDLRKLADEAAAQDPPIRMYASHFSVHGGVLTSLRSAYELWAWIAYVYVTDITHRLPGLR